jgi:predicted nucleotidyltransferase
VVSSLVDAGRALANLRYVRRQGRLVKLGTDEANRHLAEHVPAWLAHSVLVDAMVHRVPLTDVMRVHRPDVRLHKLRQLAPADSALPRPRHALEDALMARALWAAQALADGGAPIDRLGVGGSLLLGAQHAESDIDLVVYGRSAFDTARRALAAALADGRFHELGDDDWRDAWGRRGSPIELEEYRWHERRKHTKAVVQGTRLDLSLVVDHAEEISERGPFRKFGKATITAPVTDATAAFDHPARYRVDHPDVAEVVSFTPTYAGQARAGETIEASGWLEEDATGARRIVVGTSREGRGEWIRVRR